VDLSALKSFDWRSLKKYASPQAADDLNIFLEKLPQHSGNTLLIIAGITWAAAGGIGLYTTVQIQKLTELRIELDEAQALSPIVPVVTNVAVSKEEVTAFVDKTKDVYSDLSIKDNGSSIVITADSTGLFGQFREAIGHVQNGGSGWRVNVENLCVGRECDRNPLSAELKINKVSVDKPS
jgi:hypothetical protein